MIFGSLGALPPVHVELYRALRTLRNPETGISRPVGYTLAWWVGKLKEPYLAYCSRLIAVSGDI